MDNQNLAIIKALVSVAWADDVLADSEKEMLEALLSAFEATEEQSKLVREYAKEKKTLDDINMGELSSDDYRVLLQHAVLLTYLDGQQDVAEQDFLERLVEKMGIPDHEAKTLFKFATERAKRFLNLL